MATVFGQYSIAMIVSGRAISLVCHQLSGSLSAILAIFPYNKQQISIRFANVEANTGSNGAYHDCSIIDQNIEPAKRLLNPSSRSLHAPRIRRFNLEGQDDRLDTSSGSSCSLHILRHFRQSEQR